MKRKPAAPRDSASEGAVAEAIAAGMPAAQADALRQRIARLRQEGVSAREARSTALSEVLAGMREQRVRGEGDKDPEGADREGDKDPGPVLPRQRALRPEGGALGAAISNIMNTGKNIMNHGEQHDDDHHALSVPQPSAPAMPGLTDAEVAWRLMERQALALSKAGALPKHFQGRPADLMLAWAMADELNVSRMSMTRSAYVVGGKVQLSGDLLLAVARNAGVRVSETVEGEGDDMVARCTATLQNGEEVSQSFSVADAKAAGLWGSSDPWKKYPKRMLQMRARGFCLRDAIGDRLAGCYAPGELVEGEAIDVTPGR